jgi:hypothetical protein
VHHVRDVLREMYPNREPNLPWHLTASEAEKIKKKLKEKRAPKG